MAWWLALLAPRVDARAKASDASHTNPRCIGIPRWESWRSKTTLRCAFGSGSILVVSLCRTVTGILRPQKAHGWSTRKPSDLLALACQRCARECDVCGRGNANCWVWRQQHYQQLTKSRHRIDNSGPSYWHKKQIKSRKRHPIYKPSHWERHLQGEAQRMLGEKLQRIAQGKMPSGVDNRPPSEVPLDAENPPCWPLPPRWA